MNDRLGKGRRSSSESKGPVTVASSGKMRSSRERRTSTMRVRAGKVLKKDGVHTPVEAGDDGSIVKNAMRRATAEETKSKIGHGIAVQEQ